MQLKEKQAEVEQLRTSAQDAVAKAREERDKLIRQGQAELDAAREKAQRMTQEVQAQAYALADELRKLEKEQNRSAQQRAVRAREIARKDAEKLFAKSDVVHAPQREYTPLKSVQVGRRSIWSSWTRRASSGAKPDRDGLVEVRAGIIRTKAPLSKLAAPPKQQPAPKPKYQPRRTAGREQAIHEHAARSASMEINLLGMTVDEALMETDKFIDNALLTGQTTLYLIHGKGTGALRSAIQAHLRRHPSVKSFRLGTYGEGEAGVTVVELK